MLSFKKLIHPAKMPHLGQKRQTAEHSSWWRFLMKSDKQWGSSLINSKEVNGQGHGEGQGCRLTLQLQRPGPSAWKRGGLCCFSGQAPPTFLPLQPIRTPGQTHSVLWEPPDAVVTPLCGFREPRCRPSVVLCCPTQPDHPPASLVARFKLRGHWNRNRSDHREPGP